MAAEGVGSVSCNWSGWWFPVGRLGPFSGSLKELDWAQVLDVLTCRLAVQLGPRCASMSFLCVCGSFAVLLAAAQTCQYEFLCGVESLQHVNLTDVKQFLSHGVALLLPLGGAGTFTQCWCADLSAPGPGLDRAHLGYKYFL